MPRGRKGATIECPTCNGTGYCGDDTCINCSGTGRITTPRKGNVKKAPRVNKDKHVPTGEELAQAVISCHDAFMSAWYSLVDNIDRDMQEQPINNVATFYNIATYDIRVKTYLSYGRIADTPTRGS